MRSLVGLTRLCCAVVIAGAVVAVPVMSTSAAAALLPTAMLRLTVHNGGDDSGTVIKEVVLLCDPDTGSHPSAPGACKALKAVNGHFEQLPPRAGFCTKVYQPVTAVAEGWYNGSLSFKHTYGNDCELRNALSPVFDF